MRTLRRLLVVIAALVATNATSLFVLSSNQKAGVYPANADSITIPTMEMLAMSALVFLLLAVALCVPKNSWAGSAVGVLLAVAAAAVGASVVLAWAIPHHYPMAMASSTLVAVSVWLACGFTRR